MYPNNIFLFAAYLDYKVIAGVMIFILNNSCNLFEPKEVADSIVCSDTCRIPVLVNLIIGGTAYMQMAISPGTFPIPKSIRIGIK